MQHNEELVLASGEIESHKDAIAVDTIVLPVAHAPSLDLKAKSFVEGASRIVVVKNRQLNTLKPPRTRPVDRQGQKAASESLATMCCDQAHAEAPNMRADR